MTSNRKFFWKKLKFWENLFGGKKIWKLLNNFVMLSVNKKLTMHVDDWVQ